MINNQLLRKGKTGDWKNILPKKSINIINSKLHDILINWGYLKENRKG